MDDLSALANWATPLLARLSPAAQKQLARKIATGLRQAQAKRMAAQKDPDGQTWEARKNSRRRAVQAGRIKAQAHSAARMKRIFGGPGQGGRQLTSRQKFHIRQLVNKVVESGEWDYPQTWAKLYYRFNVDSYHELQSDKYEQVCRYLRDRIDADVVKKNTPRQGRLFGKLRLASHLGAKVSGGNAEVGFSRSDSRIARIHQYGLTGNVNAHGPRHQYAVRRLIGISDADRQMIEDLLVEHLRG